MAIKVSKQYDILIVGIGANTSTDFALSPSRVKSHNYIAKIEK